ncbi:hypothetical protein GH714_028537 [Hevea brasiliensis]|uniref:Uncharacterized protein n=1 Tax=Hevea brasiliensis TaxID=3981 RepID=A0A6A6KDB8_HEVBR|nr:hypothetical protein GH714_028537 [Hevea brasiliensis]
MRREIFLPPLLVLVLFEEGGFLSKGGWFAELELVVEVVGLVTAADLVLVSTLGVFGELGKFWCNWEVLDGQQTCQCAFWDENNSEDFVTQSVQESEQWAWETFNSLPMLVDAYSDQERSQLALIQRFLAGGFSLSDHHPYQSPPRCTDSYIDAMKDLHQLPWLERFVSVISDNYYEDYIQ